MNKLLQFFRPSHQHTAFSATVLLMGAVMLSRVIGYVREAYIAYAFGAGAQTDAYVAAFTLPDWLNYIVAGGAAYVLHKRDGSVPLAAALATPPP